MSSTLDQPSSPLSALFLRGRFSDVVDRALLDPNARFETHETPLVVASLGALGQLGDAELLLSHQRSLLSVDEQAFSLFHLAISAVGSAKYDAARRLLGTLFGLRNQADDSTSLFYVYQGIAFYRYATGRLNAALRCVHRAGAFLRRQTQGMDEVYVLFLWQELLGHVQALTGNFEAGAASLQGAIQGAGKLQRFESVKALTLAVAIYAARYQQRISEAATSLRKLLASVSPEERFARASLLLELARQECLLGEANRARETIGAATKLVLPSGSRRYEAVLALRLIDAEMAAGRVDVAVVLAQQTARLLDPEADLLLEMELVARKVVLLRSLRMEKMESEAAARLGWLERRSGLVRPRDQKVGIAVRGGEQTADGERKLAADESRRGGKKGVKGERGDDGGKRQKEIELELGEDLNYRQVEFLKGLRAGEMVDVHVYRKRFNVSEVTACRDLAALAKAKYVRRIGRARATRYGI